MKDHLINAYLDWVNNYVSIAKYAEAYGMSYWQANTMITLGRSLHHAREGIKTY